MSKKFPKGGIVLFIILLAVILTLNHWIQGQVAKLDKKPVKKEAVKKEVAVKQPLSKAKPSTNEVIKRTRVLPGTEYVEHLFYRGDVEIARQRVSASGLIEETGTVPDGKVKFFDAYKNTYGEETYRHGKRHGVAKTYYADGQLQSKAYYRDGKLMANQEYYSNGNLRFEVDYQGARNYPGDKEVGLASSILWMGPLNTNGT